MIFDFLKKRPQLEKKDNPTGAALLFLNMGKTKERNLKQYLHEGYCQNVIVYRCIREITTALGSVNIELYKGDKLLEKHEVIDLLQRPNPTEGYSQFIRHAFTDYLYSGNMFITSDKPDGKALELWAQSPLHMEVVAGPRGIPKEYVFRTGGNKTVFPVDQVRARSQCFHFKTYNPENPFIGLSPISHIALAADTHNNGLRWNSSLLENGARPSGIMRMPAGVTVPKEEKGKLREFIQQKLQGPNNSGEIVYLENGAEWQELGQNAKQMDYANTMQTMAKYIASAYGVPLPLVDNDASSYNNIEQAKERLWTDTVLPLLKEFLESFGNWLLPAYGEDLRFSFDQDSIPALEGIRARRFERIAKAAGVPILSANEAREAVGYDPEDNPLSDSRMIPTGYVPLDAVGAEEDAQKAMRLLGYSESDIKNLLAEMYEQKV